MQPAEENSDLEVLSHNPIGASLKPLSHILDRKRLLDFHKIVFDRVQYVN